MTGGNAPQPLAWIMAWVYSKTVGSSSSARICVPPSSRMAVIAIMGGLGAAPPSTASKTLIRFAPGSSKPDRTCAGARLPSAAPRHACGLCRRDGAALFGPVLQYAQHVGERVFHAGLFGRFPQRQRITESGGCSAKNAASSRACSSLAAIPKPTSTAATASASVTCGGVSATGGSGAGSGMGGGSGSPCDSAPSGSWSEDNNNVVVVLLS